MKKIYLDITQLNDPTSIWMKDTEIVRAGTTVYTMSVKDKNTEYQRYADEYDIHFIFDDDIPKIDFYTIPQVDIVATDSEGGYIGSVGQVFDLESDAPICYIDKEQNCYLLANSGKEFLEKASNWKMELEAYKQIELFVSKKDAEKEYEFFEFSRLEEGGSMEHKGTVSIETERLILRRFTLNDVDAAFRNWTNDDKVTEFLRWPTHKDVSVTESILSDWIENYKKDSFYQWAIELKEINEPIGTISVVDMDEKTDKVHIGYCIGSNWWNKGYTSEAFSGIIPFLFEQVRVKRIESQHDPNNPNSGKVMEKCGLVYEGTLRHADWSNKGIVDACMYSLLAEDYFKRELLDE